MTLKQKLRIVAATSLIWIISLSACAGLKIKTWFLDAKEQNALIRKASTGEITERLSYIEADGYRCYSPIDDEAWRTRLAQCCAAVP